MVSSASSKVPSQTGKPRSALILSVLIFLCSPLLHAVPWLPFGPFGGDARAFGVDPSDHQHLYLGTSNGWIYETHDGGRAWARLAKVGKRDDLVLDHILVDPTNAMHLVVGVWVLGSRDGSLYTSRDAGHSWTPNADLQGESIRSLAVAPSDPKILVAGTLKSIFRSNDGGEHWKRISSADSAEIHEVESIAIDPKNPDVIYAGTWHLPWKTSDGGEHWTNIKEGIIDDSDVFSIIVDPQSPQTVYASACSGIYKSDDAGNRFRKIQGIPSTARRTRVLKQDPQQLPTVFAGTTEGLFKTTDEGKTWGRTTGPEVIVNDVFVDPKDSKRILLATDRGGVLSSDDGGVSFSPANNGYTVRQVVTYAADPHDPAKLYIGLLNDKEWGGIFASDNGGITWVQQSTGLGGRDVFGLVAAEDGTLIAGTSHGIFRLKDSFWTEVADPRQSSSRPGARNTKGTRLPQRTTPTAAHPARATAGTKQQAQRHRFPARLPESPIGPNPEAPGVFALAAEGARIFAVSTRGILTSTDSGGSWTVVSGLPAGEYRNIATAASVAVAATLDSLVLSTDSGASWSELPKPDELMQIGAVSTDDGGDVWVGGREGLFVLRSGSKSWQSPPNLSIHDVNSLYFDRAGKQVLVTANTSTTLVFAIRVADLVARSSDTGWQMRFVRVLGDHMIGGTLFDGIVLQPRMVDSPLATAR